MSSSSWSKAEAVEVTNNITSRGKYILLDRAPAICFESELTRVTSQLLSTDEGYTSVQTQRFPAESPNLLIMRITVAEDSVLDLQDRSYVAGQNNIWRK